MVLILRYGVDGDVVVVQVMWSRGGGLSSRPSHIGPLPHLNRVMTEWANWGPWGRCIRSCGGGVRSRSRACATVFPRVMPGSGIRTSHDHCSTGDSVEYGVCGKDLPCPPGQVSGLSFRAAQCRHYNNRRVFGRLVNNWVPYTQSGINPCALVCEGEGEGIVYTFGKVTDGTHCRTDDSKDGLCVNGRCLRLSCDGRLGGVASEDMCRVCGGSNDTCTRHVGIFHSDLPSNDQPDDNQRNRQHSTMYGYYEVANIPQGATNVLVKDKSPNFLALKAENKFLLNGNWLIDWPGDVDAAGTPFSYVRTEDNSETLMALGPTKENLKLLVLLREHNPGIYYEYWTPNSNTYKFSSAIANSRRPFENEILKPTITEKPKKKKKKKKKKKDPKPGKEKHHKGKSKGESKGQRKSTSKLPITCGVCVKARRAKEKFCTSDFVSRVEVLGSDEVIGERRYEVLVHQSYKNTVPLLHKEFLWLDNPCNCPRLRTGRSYIVMGQTAITKGNEVRFVLGSGSYVKRYNPRNLARILRIRHNELKHCRPWRRDLRFQRNSDISQLSSFERIAANQTSAT
ncbi:unnamed protein product, partial [Meganyctiphanes norvegica]